MAAAVEAAAVAAVAAVVAVVAVAAAAVAAPVRRSVGATGEVGVEVGVHAAVGDVACGERSTRVRYHHCHQHDPNTTKTCVVEMTAVMASVVVMAVASVRLYSTASGSTAGEAGRPALSDGRAPS